MTQLIFHHDHRVLPPASENTIPVQLYGLSGQERGDISVIGNPVIDKVKRLGVQIPERVMDFLTIALAVTAADTFVRREEAAADGWTRLISMKLPLSEPDRWRPLKHDLERTLHFLSGDMWELTFTEGGYSAPSPYRWPDRHELTPLRGLDCVCLFSGGLDSAIGAIDLLGQNRAPLLVSHAYKGDKSHQDRVAGALSGLFSRLEINADPHHSSGGSDITMRTRSLNFLAFAAVGASAVQLVSQQDQVDIFVPENGFISLNAPLTSRRVGTLSTRTTHPYFLKGVQGIFDAVGIPVKLLNPYQFKTKGQMVCSCQNQQVLAQIVDDTVSCSHWKRSNQQCGICVPCIIRRAALHAGSISENTTYTFDRLERVLAEPDRRDDLMALSIAIKQKSVKKIGPWILDSGPLPSSTYTDFQGVFCDGLSEVESFLISEAVL